LKALGLVISSTFLHPRWPPSESTVGKAQSVAIAANAKLNAVLTAHRVDGGI
jgi:hypothetical protein